MAMTALPGPAPLVGAVARPKVETFGAVLKRPPVHQSLAGQVGGPQREGAPLVAGPSLAGKAHRAHLGIARAVSAAARTAAPTASAKLQSAVKAIDHVAQAQQRMDQVLALAQSGQSFTPAELLALQARVYAASQELDLAGKVVEKATGGLKQVLQTQV